MLKAETAESQLKPLQCDIKATTKRVDRQPIATPKPLQSHPKATPMLPQCGTKATSMRPQSRPHATINPSRSRRMPKSEGRKPEAIRCPKSERGFFRWACCLRERLRVRVSDFELPSSLGFRHSLRMNGEAAWLPKNAFGCSRGARQLPFEVRNNGGL